MSQTLYRFFNGVDELLYVGISVRPWDRWRQHAGEKPWWEEVTKVTVETFATRAEVDAAETIAIQAEKPRYNIAKAAVRPAFRAEHVPLPFGDAADAGCECGWVGPREEYVDHFLIAGYKPAKHKATQNHVRKPSVKFIKDMWPTNTYAPRLPRQWRTWAIEYLDQGLTRSELREAADIAIQAWRTGTTENPWNYMSGIARRLIREKDEPQ